MKSQITDNPLQLLTTQEQTIDSDALLEMVNETRKECGEKPIRNNDFVARIKDELEGEYYETFVVQNANNTTSEKAVMQLKQALRVAARESKSVRRSLVDKLEARYQASPIQRELSTMEILQIAMVSEQGRIAAEQRAEAAAIENKSLSNTVQSLEKHFTKGMTIPAFCKGLNGVNTSKMMWWAFEREWVFNEQRDPEKDPRWRVASYARDKYLTEDQTQITPHGMEAFTKFSPVLLEKGCHRLYQLYMKGELPMKKTWNGEFSHDKAIYTPEGK